MRSVKQNVNKTNPKIKVIENGPYVVYGDIPINEQEITVDSAGVPIRWTQLSSYSQKMPCSLCRCGQSKRKPFCDGTHIKISFNGTETAKDETYFDNSEIIDGPTLKLIDIEEICASARFCHRSGGIWNLIPQSDKIRAKRIACEETCDCPSGRLILYDKKTGKVIEPKLKPSIVLSEDPAMGVSGPIWARGGIPVESGQGKTYRIRNRVTLCRCGKSQNKPFCDSSHYPEEHEPHGEKD